MHLNIQKHTQTHTHTLIHTNTQNTYSYTQTITHTHFHKQNNLDLIQNIKKLKIILYMNYIKLKV